jgi:predicted O-linked N-acetylglucosamine transferase (SPINDLY family)
LASTIGSYVHLAEQIRQQAPQLMQLAVDAYRGGQRADAAALCARIVEFVPDYFDAQHLLGVAELDGGNFAKAEQALQRAVSLNPQSPEACSNLGLALFQLKRLQEARTFQERALSLQPNFPTALTNLGNTLMWLGQVEHAVQAHDAAIRLVPDYSDAHVNRGMALLILERNEEADQSFDRALALRPGQFQALAGKGMAGVNLRHFDAALTWFDTALAINPGAAEVLAHRGRLHVQTKQLAKAAADFDAALAISPELEAGWRGKAQIAILAGNVAQAVAACNRVLVQTPDCALTLLLLGNCYTKQGEIDAALACFDRSLALNPDSLEAITKKIFTLDFIEADFAAHQAVRRSWWQVISARTPRRALPPRNLDSGRRIVVGYVSSDFRDHSALLTFKPLLLHYDRTRFDVVCYSCSPVQDAVTDECRALVDRWVDAWQMSDRELADRIEADGIDILVDLSGHTDGNRLGVFAAKPAPIQATGWGHVTGTGLATMDYLFADPVLIPEAARHLFAETVYDLPCLITLVPPQKFPISPLPMLRNGHVTFGVFNRIDKISDGAVVLWSRVLQAVPGSVILVKHGTLSDPLVRDSLLARFAAHGVDVDRIRCLGATSREEHLAAFAEVDISLDPFPQNGGVSTWESLYAGIPVIAKLGASCSSRAGGAIVTAVGLADWVAEDDDGYVAIAAKYASRPDEVAALRAELPSLLAQSEAGDTERYVRRVEEGFRRFWRDYCAMPGAAGA